MKRLLAAALLVLGASACGGTAQPKQFVIAFTQQSITAGNSADCPAVPDPKVASTFFLQDTTFTVYQGDANDWYLDVGGGPVYQGTFKDGTYTFTGVSTDDLIDSASSKTWEQKSTGNDSITFKVDGSTVTGSATHEDNVSCQSFQTDACKNSGRPEYNGFNSNSGNTIDCIYAATFSGVQLEDAKFVKGTSTPGDGSSSSTNTQNN